MIPLPTSSTASDIDEILRLYRLASELQKKQFTVHWPEFDRSMVAKEVAEGRQWKIVVNEEVAIVWATTLSDPQIWEEKNSDPALYIHRIAANPNFRGQKLVLRIVEWARDYAIAHSKKFVRMDTVGYNPALIEHYVRCGFDFVDLVTLKSTEGLPAHYSDGPVSLFEMAL